jgi:hypothetical protein
VREGRAGMGRPVLFVVREAGGWAVFVCEVLGVASRDAVDAGAIWGISLRREIREWRAKTGGARWPSRRTVTYCQTITYETAASDESTRN